MTARPLSVWLLLVTIWLSAGCGSTLPTYPWRGREAAWQQMRRRMEQVRGFSGQCQLLVKNQGPLPVRLEAAVALRLPDRFRLRAWKGPAPVIDLAGSDRGLWLWISQEISKKTALPKPDPDSKRPLGAAHALWSPLGAPWFGDPATRFEDDGGCTFRLIRSTGPDDSAQQVAEIDRDTLTVRRYTLRAEGRERFTLRFDRYRQHEQAVWPQRWIFETGDRRMEIHLKTYRFNPSLPEAAFKPARGARRVF